MQYVDLATQKIIDKEDDDDSTSSSVVPLDETIEMWNYEKNGTERVHADDVPAKLSVDSHSFVSGKKVPVYKDDIETVEEYDPLEALNMVQFDGAQVARPKDAQNVFLQRKYGTGPQQAIAGAEGLASGATFGASEVAEDLLGVLVEDIEGRKEANPWTAGTTNLAGAVMGAPAVAAKGIGLGMKAAGNLIPGGVKQAIARKAIGAIGKTAAKSAFGAAKYGTQAAIEGGLMGAADYAKNVILHDEDFSTDAMIAHAKPAALISGLIGTAAGTVAPHLAKKMKGWSRDSRKTIRDARVAAGLPADKVEADVDLRTLKKSRSPYDPEKFGVEFKKDPAGDGIYTYNDGAKEVVLDTSKLPGQIIDFNNKPAVDDYVSILTEDDRVKNVLRPKALKTDFRKEVLAGYDGLTDLDDATIDYLSKEKETRALGNALGIRKGVSNQALSEPLSDAAIEAARDAHGQTVDFLATWRPQKGKTFLNNMVKAVRREEMLKNARSNLIGKAARTADGFIDGENLVFYNRKSIPQDAILNSFRKLAKAEKPLAKDLNAVLRALGAGRPELDKFQSHFSEAEREVVGSYIARKLDETSQWRISPNLERLKEVIQGDRAIAIRQMDDAVTRMEDALSQKYGNSAVAKTGLTGGAIRRYIRRDLIDDLKDPVTGKPEGGNSAAIQKLEAFADEFKDARTMPDGREIPYTLEEWRGLRQRIDRGLENFFGKDNIPIDKSKLLELRHWMEEKVMSKAEELLGPDAVAREVEDYKAGKMLYRMTNDGYKSPSVYNIIDKGISKSAAKHGLTSMDVFSGTVGGGAGAAIFGGPGALVGVGVGAGAKAIRDNADYMYYLASKNVIPKIERTFRAANKGALEFSQLYGTRIRIAASALYINQSDMDYIEKNREKIENALNAPMEYSEQVNESAGELNFLKEGLGTKLAEKGHNALSFIYDKMPKSPYPPHSELKWQPTAIQSQQFKRYVNAVLYPETIFKNFGQGYISSEEIEVLKTVYPGMYMRFKQLVGEKTMGKPMSMDQKALLKRVFGAETSYLPPDQSMLNAQADEEVQEEERIRKSNGKLSGQQKTENETIQDK